MGSPQGPLPALLPPATHDGFAARFDPVPGIGEHTGAILGELGYADADVAALRAAGAV
jgi:itaconate CoA-transferase